jgi:hypothetical protein
MPELALGAKEAPPLRVVQEGAVAAVEELARGALRSLGTVGGGEVSHDTHPCRISPAPHT